MRRLTLRLLGTASAEDFDAILAGGEIIDVNGSGLDPELVARIDAKIAAARQPTTE